MTILDLQMALKAAGFAPGPLDGIAGPQTRAAIRAFQASHGLVADGIAGPLTQKRLLGPGAPISLPAALPWLAEAKRLIGTKEAAGAAENAAILNWADTADIAYDHDETPWCGLFIAHCIASTLPDESLPANPLGARQWLTFGIEAAPQLGAVMVFWRGTRQGWSGHVALYWGEEADTYIILGGNQSDAVTLTKIAKSRFLGARWPRTVAPLQMIRQVTSDMPVSLNEA